MIKLLVGLGALAYLGKQAYQVLDGITVEMQQAQVRGVSGGSNPQLHVVLPVQVGNDNIFGVTITKLEGGVFYGGVELSRVRLNRVAIAPNKTTLLPLEINVPLRGVYNDVSNIISSGNLLSALINPITFKGTLYVAGLSFPIEKNIPIA